MRLNKTESDWISVLCFYYYDNFQNKGSDRLNKDLMLRSSIIIMVDPRADIFKGDYRETRFFVLKNHK